MITAQEIINVAEQEIGYKEKASNNNLDSKTANAGSANWTKYGRDYGKYHDAWCCVFVWWVFKQAGASDLFYGGNKTAKCVTLMNYYKNKGQFVTKDFKKGDIIFFDSNGNGLPNHVGIISKVNNNTIYTIEGNVSNCVGAREYSSTAKKILGCGRPPYEFISDELYEYTFTIWIDKPRDATSISIVPVLYGTGDPLFGNEVVQELQPSYPCVNILNEYGEVKNYVPKLWDYTTEQWEDVVPTIYIEDDKSWYKIYNTDKEIVIDSEES